jgi:hypothetical protein
MVAQRIVERQVHPIIGEAMDLARQERPPLTTPQPEEAAR